ncbi:hypothetical protein F4778DRAFT_711748 [Xylariomycetidae sp. FL2044]|nr:hypothetical protein F4778DRAFT_711748 [Xylariomycetidae sp. FL2044]
MARKGSRKVRTGCLTCKVRKVKCDEGKPYCQRCATTGRKCDGYAPPSESGLSWHRPRQIFPTVNDPRERRSLQFFCEVAAPFLSGPIDSYFWTQLVLQFSTFEPAVRHSIIAISGLYEQANGNPESAQLTPDNDLTLQHYNAAIRELKAVNSEPLVLLVCILFVCIEFLRGNSELVSLHCKHGIQILERAESQYGWVKEHMSPVFRRMSIIPCFFSSSYESYPKLIGMHDEIPPSFSSFSEAQFYIDGLVNRTVRLVRGGDAYRAGHLRDEPVPEALLAEQRAIVTLLPRWRDAFWELESRADVPGKTRLAVSNILIRYEVARVWAEMTFQYDERVYDQYLERFRWIVEEADSLVLAGFGDSRKKHLTFEMGFLPSLYYVAMKCRDLDTRIRALALMKSLGAARENLWELATMHAAARRMIEIEHDATLDQDGQLSGEPSCSGLPADEMRIRDISVNPKPVFEKDADGVEVVGRIASFFMRTPEGDIYLRSEFVAESR